MENELEKEPLTIYLSGSEGAETRLNLSDVSLNFMRFFIHLSFNYYIYPIYFLLLAIFFGEPSVKPHMKSSYSVSLARG